MPSLRRDLLQRAGHVEGMLAAFELAGAGDQRERQRLPKRTPCAVTTGLTEAGMVAVMKGV